MTSGGQSVTCQAQDNDTADCMYLSPVSCRLVAVPNAGASLLCGDQCGARGNSLNLCQGRLRKRFFTHRLVVH